MPALTFYMLLFLGVGVFFLFFHLVLGKLVRPSRPEPEKLTIYECGEPTVGSAWIQFDLRYYVVALLFVIFDVEVAFFFPWAVVFGNANMLARSDLDPEFEPLSDKQEKPVPAKPVRRLAITRQLLPVDEKGDLLIPPVEDASRNEITRNGIDPETAHNYALLAFADIFVFFGVLMVGFAYLWKRGDINWVRSTTSERDLEKPLETLPARQSPALAGPRDDF